RGCVLSTYFFYHAPATPHLYTLSLHDALPIFFRDLQHAVMDDAEARRVAVMGGAQDERSVVFLLAGDHHAGRAGHDRRAEQAARSEEHTSELQSRGHLVCRLLLEKKKTTLPIP